MKTFITLALVCFLATQAVAQTTKKPATTPAAQKTAVKKTVKPVANAPKQIRVAKTEKPGTRVKITTDLGIIVVHLYDETPLHRDNFIKLANEHFFDSLLFHRIISGFMIQGGDPQSKYAPPGQMLGMGDVGYTIPAEFNTSLFHKKGALAAARTSNPEKASSGCQFYIVQGRIISDAELNQLEMQKGIKYTPEQRAIYKTIGGTPMLDAEYTVYGEVESGLDVIDKIASVPKAPGDRPISDVHMYIEVIK